VVTKFPHDELVLVLSRETVFAAADIERAVNCLRALGWTAHQIRRGVHYIARHPFASIELLILSARLAPAVDVDAVLDALTPDE
jgi:hypothetical protein